MIAPETEQGVAEAIRAAHDARQPLAIEGAGSKRGMLRPVRAAETLTTRALTGITLYKPAELVISARAGTPIAEIEAALAEKGQQIISEPPSPLGVGGATLGGIAATNLSGPRRIAWGSMRDHMLGIRAVKGDGEVFRSGGRVLKNVTGLDLCKLLSGSHGTLGVLTEITFKVLPAAEATGTLAVSVPDVAAGVRALSAGLGSPFGVSGAALLPGGLASLGLAGPVALLRIEDFAESVTYRKGRLREVLAPYGDVSLVEGAAARSLWRGVRDVTFLDAAPDEAVWRLSVAPSAAAAVCAALPGAKLMLDWGGGLIWVAGEASEAMHAAVVAATGPGSFTLFRAPDALRGAVAVMPAEPAPLAAISARVKALLDPAGILNPGRMGR
ncbi:FAD-binding protein [Rhodovarius crocodyli]|uniref:FAD-binding protein n=1 Tax=Rhodovarius crocodyli TaxID=1979269 RepID=A0A437MM58_9PROT|nr:FAD-binding protein [Rhodovarius crocodyli]RVT98712.1 FAD-binding protein [Rhodovarius crocodyli]